MRYLEPRDGQAWLLGPRELQTDTQQDRDSSAPLSHHPFPAPSAMTPLTVFAGGPMPLIIQSWGINVWIPHHTQLPTLTLLSNLYEMKSLP